MEKIKENSYAFYRAIFFLSKNRRLIWVFDGRDKVSAQLTNELKVELRYYNNGAKPGVIDFDCIYSYFNKEHELIRQTLSERFRESTEEYKLFSCKRFYDIVLEQASQGTITKNDIDPHDLLRECMSLFYLNGLNVNKDMNPFDEVLLKKVLCLAVE